MVSIVTGALGGDGLRCGWVQETGGCESGGQAAGYNASAAARSPLAVVVRATRGGRRALDEESSHSWLARLRGGLWREKLPRRKQVSQGWAVIERRGARLRYDGMQRRARW